MSNPNQAKDKFICYNNNMNLCYRLKGDIIMNNIQCIITEIDKCIKNQDNESLTLAKLARCMGYSGYQASRKFKEISGMSLRDYVRYRKLAFALEDVRNKENGILDIAVKYGFSSHEAFTHAFKKAYGITPSEYRTNPRPVPLLTAVKSFDCYLSQTQTDTSGIKTYFIKIPAHKFLHIRNYESIGYWDFWQKQSMIEGQDYETVCSLLDGIGGSDDRVMAYINEPNGRICAWGIPLAEAYGVRLPSDYSGDIPPQMQLTDVEEGEYIVFEHGAFDIEKNAEIEAKIEKAMKNFDYSKSGYELDTAQGRVFYFYHDCKRFWKYIIPVKKIIKNTCI